ncbi:MAG: CCA tRNA nucleotidyltransferase [Candidatus Syntrophosphaera sp.]
MNLNELRLLLADKIQGTDFAGRAYFTGGCVRDHLLGRETSKLDVDIAVELPKGGVRLARYLRNVLPMTGLKIQNAFGTATALYGDVQLDFVMTRSEKYIPGSRFPKVKFADLTTDCLRRDFTINALYMDVTRGEVLDPSKMGVEDLERKIIRCLQDPFRSFREDPLRMLRALRFSIALGFELEPVVLQAIKVNADLTRSLSRTRLLNEIQRLEMVAGPEDMKTWANLLKETGINPHLNSKIERK